MSRTRRNIRTVAREAHYPGVVLSAAGSLCSVRLYSGQTLTAVPIIGGPVIPGQNVTVQYQDGKPHVQAPSAGVGTFSRIETSRIAQTETVETDTLRMAGWHISDDGVISTALTEIRPDGSIRLGQAPEIIVLNSQHETYRLWAGAEAGENAPFSVDKTGHMVSTSALIGGWTVTQTQISSSGIILDSANGRIIAGEPASHIVIAGSSRSIFSSNYVSGVTGWSINAAGDAEFNNVRVRGSLKTVIFEYNELSATAGSFGVFKSAAKLAVEYTTPGGIGGTNTLIAENDDRGGILFATGDILWLRTFDSNGIHQAFLEVLSYASQGRVTHYSVRLCSGDTNTRFVAGTGIADLGNNHGYIVLSADNAVGASANISVIIHSGTPWLDYSSQNPQGKQLVVRIGNLQGIGSLTGYGWFVGDLTGHHAYYSTSSSRLVIRGEIIITGGSGISNFTDAGPLVTAQNLDGIPDGTNYVRLTPPQRTGATRAYSALNSSGALVTCVIPQSAVTPSGSGLYLDASHMGYYANGQWKTYMDNSGNFRFQGNAANNYLQWNAAANRLEGVGGGTVQWYADATDGKIKAGAGAIEIGREGFIAQRVEDGYAYRVRIDGESVSLVGGIANLSISEFSAIRWRLYNQESTFVAKIDQLQFVSTYNLIRVLGLPTNVNHQGSTAYTPGAVFIGTANFAPPVQEFPLGILVVGNTSSGTPFYGPGLVRVILPVSNQRFEVGSTGSGTSAPFWVDRIGNARVRGLAVGVDGITPGSGSIYYTNSIIRRIGTVNFAGSIFCPLTAPLRSVNWDGDSKSTVSTSTELDLSAVFGVNPSVKAVLVRLAASETGSFYGNDYYIGLGPTSSNWGMLICRPLGGGTYAEAVGPVPVSVGKLYYRIRTSGTNTMQVWIEIWGYWI